MSPTHPDYLKDTGEEHSPTTHNPKMTNQAFQDWLNQCPVQYFLLDSDYEQKTYQFVVEDPEETDEEV